jgi:hypothetical protein
MLLKNTFTYIIAFFLITTISFSQTCCSGGVPVSSNIGFSNKESKTLQFSVSANFNTLKTLYSESTALDDDQRKRATQSFLARAHYSFTDRFSMETFIPFVRQTRTIYSSSTAGSVDFESTFGIGDPLLLASYKIINSDFKLTLGAGPQIPLGAFDRRNSNNLILVEDLQPGSGAWDLILLGIADYALPSRQSTSLFTRVIYSHTGENPNARNGLQTYEFGNDIQIIAGLADQFLIGTKVIAPSLALRYRAANNDTVDSNDISGTGGEWLFAKATLGVEFLWQSSLSFDIELPLYTFVNETQLSPNSIITLSWSKSFSFSKNEVDLNF